MAYDDADNSIRGIPTDYVTPDGRILYVYDATADAAGSGEGYTYASDATGTTGHIRYPAGRDAVIAQENDDDEIFDDSFRALYLAYDAAYDINDETDDFDTEQDDISRDEGFADLGDLAAAFGIDAPSDSSRDESLSSSNSTIDAIDARLYAPSANVLQTDTIPAPIDEDVVTSYNVAVSPVIYGSETARPRHDVQREAVAIAAMAEDNPEAKAAVAALKMRQVQKRRKQSAYAFLAAGVMAVVLLVVFVNRLVSRDAAVAAIAGGTSSVVRGDLPFTVVESGTIEPISSVAVLPSASGTVDEVYVQEGDVVEEGNILFTIANDELSAAVNAAKAQLDAANAELSRANAAVSAAYNTYNSEVDSYLAGQNPAFDKDGLLASITAAESQRDSALANANAARDELEAANAQAAACDVVAPADGTVVSLVIQPGDTVAALTQDSPKSAAPLQIANISQLQVTVLLDNNDMASVAEGQPAQVSLVDSDVVLEGTVATIDQEPLYGPDGTLSYLATVQIDNSDGRMRPGDRVSVSIITDVVHDVLLVPVAAVSNSGDETESVWVVTDDATGHSEHRMVNVGASNGEYIVVTSGLNVGDIVGLP